MTKEEYQCLRLDRPDLLLPPWYRIAPMFRGQLLAMSLKQLVAGRTYTLLTRNDVAIPEPGEAGIHTAATHEAKLHGVWYKEV